MNRALPKFFTSTGRPARAALSELIFPMTDSKKHPEDGASSRAPSSVKGAPRRRDSAPDQKEKRGAPDRRREGAYGGPRRKEDEPRRSGPRRTEDGAGRDAPRRVGDEPRRGYSRRNDDEPRRSGPRRGDDDEPRRYAPRREKREFQRGEEGGGERRGGRPRGEFAGAEHRDDRPRRDGVDEQGDGRPRGAAGALIDLDRDLMKLLARRAVLVSRIRGGRDHAASAEAVQAEKAVRMAWETNSLAFSKDPRFTRQLFTLLQDLKVLTREQSEHAAIFTLSPPAKPVSGELTGPADTRTAQMYTALAACRGDALSLNSVLLSEALLDTAKACSQIGAAVSYHSQGSSLGGVSVDKGNPVCFTGKMVYLGEDMFTLCLMVFLAVGRPGTCRLAGGARLKGADLSFLRHALPLFGARLAHVVPRSQGLPATLESSGDIPPLVVLPADLPLEAVCALLLAPLAWNVPVVFNLAALPASVATAALAEVGPVHLACGADVENRGSHLVYTPGPLHVPVLPDLPLDPALSAHLLALPAFVGGSLTLKGRWSAHLPESRDVEQLLSWAGLSLRVLDQAVAVEADRPPFALPPQCNDLSPELGPLFLALAARQHMLTGGTPPLAQLAPFPTDEMDSALAQDFFERLGLVYAGGSLSLSGNPDSDPKPAKAPAYPAWTSPDAYWGMAFALSALMRPGLRLANPGSVAEVMPPFWGVYNTLPSPADPAREPKEKPQEPKDDKPARRRIIAD